MDVHEIKTERLLLRRPRFDDAARLPEILNDLEISRWLTHVPFPYTQADADTFVARVAAKKLGDTYFVEDASGLVGCIGIARELGYWFAKRSWGHGYATEAAGALLAAYFQNPGAAPVLSGHFSGNQRSANVLQKLGFGYLGHSIESVPLSTGVPVANQRMILTPEQYHALNPWVIDTPRLRIRPLAQADTADLARIGGHPDVAPMIFAATVPWPEDEVARFIELFRWRGRMGFRMGIEHEGKLIGQIAFGAPPKAALPQTAYFLDPDHGGQGLMTEALLAFLPAAMDRFNVPELGADAFNDNPASQHILTKLGFEKMGEEMGTSRARVEPAPVSVYRLSREALG